MADVYLARLVGEAGFSKRIALKVLRPELARDPLAVSYFLDEARLQAQVDHPNIVQIADLGHRGHEYFIAMEHVDGVDLGRIVDVHSLARRRVPVAIAVGIARQLCAGLHAAHVATDAAGAPLGLVHRDVKSANVLVASSGIVKLGDFGIAKARQRVRKTLEGQVLGTVEYMAPEQRTGASVDARADQYGIAAVAYELLSGEIINLDVARRMHLGAEGWPHLPPLMHSRPDVPAELDACLFRALSFQPAQRFASCAELDDALEAIAQRHGLAADLRAVAAWFAEVEPLWRDEPAPSATGTRPRVAKS
jgi:serine/threonine-protein kinase